METKLKIKNMNELQIKLQKKYPELTDDDLEFSKGKEDDLIENISDRLGKTEEEIMDIIDDMQNEKNSDKRSVKTKSEPDKSKTAGRQAELKKKQK